MEPSWTTTRSAGSLPSIRLETIGHEEPAVSDLEQTASVADLRAEVIRLGPWHVDVEITPEISTAAFLEAPPGTYSPSLGEVAFLSPSPRAGFSRKLRRIFPDGLQGRSVLDCACNCGAYLFWAKELGAGECFGFDVRQHWIDQARFLAEHRAEPTEEMRFEVRNLYDLPELGLGEFDVVLFNGIFYHLPDPVTGLKIAADLASELLIVNSATRNGFPDGQLVCADEGTTEVMSGIYGLNWFPTGPEVVTRILNWAGFPETRTHQWRTGGADIRQSPELGRIDVLAGRNESLFRAYDREPDVQWLIDLLTLNVVPKGVPSEAMLLVASGGDERMTKLRDSGISHFPRSEEGGYGGDPASSAAAIAHLEDLRVQGATHLLFPATSFSWLERYRSFRDHLERHYTAAWREHNTCLLYVLDDRLESGT